MYAVTSSKRSTEPTRDRATDVDDASGLSLHAIACARTFVKQIFDHSAADMGSTFDNFDNSSSLAVTTLDSLDGNLSMRVVEIPLSLLAKFTAFTKVGPRRGLGISGQTGCKISARVDPEYNWQISAKFRGSLRSIPILLFSCDFSHFTVSNPPTAILPLASVVERDRLGGLKIASLIAVNRRVFPLESSPKMSTISPLLHVKFAPRQAQALFVTCAAHKSETEMPLVGEAVAVRCRSL
mmetsp:Transcript_25491/g.38135  ORF Transcript_25491/g.38135 Transcript_25491/m.38135 type:complete len:239 (-) Transcript_25491:2105-2821(-)